MAKLVSKVYGDALFEAAMERDMLSPVYEEVQSLQRSVPCGPFSWKIRIWRSF
mgnify:CR=1 FL=1